MKEKTCFICGSKLLTLKRGKKTIGTLCTDKKHAELYLKRKLSKKEHKKYFKETYGVLLTK